MCTLGVEGVRFGAELEELSHGFGLAIGSGRREGKGPGFVRAERRKLDKFLQPIERGSGLECELGARIE